MDGGVDANTGSGPAPDVSVVVPAYRAAASLGENVRRLHAHLADRPQVFGRSEIVVVDDGSSDGTFEAIPTDLPGVVPRRLPRNRGKGAAVREGMLHARGTVRLFVDCDLPYALEATDVMVDVIRTGRAEIAIGSRDLPGSAFHVDAGPLRRVASATFTWLVHAVFLGGPGDTQCGIKGFRGDVAARLFARSVVDRFAFDVEILHLARLEGLRVARVPVRLVRQDPSSVRLFSDSARMGIDLLRILWRHGLARRPLRTLELAAGEGAGS